MYGLLHQSLTAWVRTLEDGEALLQQVESRFRNNLEDTDGSFACDEFHRRYTDAQSNNLIRICSEVTGVSEDECKLRAGRFVIQTLIKRGYKDMLDTLGSDLFTLLSNIDSVHSHCASTFPSAALPSLCPTFNDDGSISVAYSSQREGYAPFMLGALQAVATDLFHLNVGITHRTNAAQSDAARHVFVIFKNGASEQCLGPQPSPSPAHDPHRCTASLPPALMDELFPWHFAFDRGLRVTSVGRHLAARFDGHAVIGARVDRIFAITEPTSTTGSSYSSSSSSNSSSSSSVLSIDATVPWDVSKLLSHPSNASFILTQIAARDNTTQHHSTTTSNNDDGGDGGCLSSVAGGDGGCIWVVDDALVSTAPTACEGTLANAGHRGDGDGHGDAVADCDTGGGNAGDGEASTGRHASVRETQPQHANTTVAPAALPPACATTSSSCSSTSLSTPSLAPYVRLRGHFVHDSSSDTVLFVGVPHVTTPHDMRTQDVELHHFPAHSNGRDVVFGHVHQRVAATASHAIEVKMAQLDCSLDHINTRTAQVDALINSILPPSVAHELSSGRIPPAKRFEHVTVLFSDIAGFTAISSGIPSIEVMHMLHELFVKFDDLADKHGCYKVETIGDAYMVAAGCPEECEDHALRIARLAIDMVHAANSVISPLDGEPLSIRVGIHTGPLMAGVVGRARPRYCFFGNTVNVASRMESTGLPGCVQCTYRFVRALPVNHGLRIISRGAVEVKGKGSMRTFLLVGTDTTFASPLLPRDAEALAAIPDAPALSTLATLARRVRPLTVRKLNTTALWGRAGATAAGALDAGRHGGGGGGRGEHHGGDDDRIRGDHHGCCAPVLPPPTSVKVDSATTPSAARHANPQHLSPAPSACISYKADALAHGSNRGGGGGGGGGDQFAALASTEHSRHIHDGSVSSGRDTTVAIHAFVRGGNTQPVYNPNAASTAIPSSTKHQHEQYHDQQHDQQRWQWQQASRNEHHPQRYGPATAVAPGACVDGDVHEMADVGRLRQHVLTRVRRPKSPSAPPRMAAAYMKDRHTADTTASSVSSSSAGNLGAVKVKQRLQAALSPSPPSTASSSVLGWQAHARVKQQ
ncbi:guanylate cyclase [Salpingoeca rosetta]|uniref:guanylate cyclase n=1 Tax=Salpingoeca rosetta (strain ATCC 50818 / BSB-021) TaxID=946362 RepID=F2U5L4_SALR5|nr:guanylate cyclase [Salpingoeca rosetta]EGD83230.1 guanylate cyclase [Salpingoeca rosetta]|eukprot:XP_004995594.1 guanylate cyclase [Salpingoeca rosetta]